MPPPPNPPPTPHTHTYTHTHTHTCGGPVLGEGLSFQAGRVETNLFASEAPQAEAAERRKARRREAEVEAEVDAEVEEVAIALD